MNVEENRREWQCSEKYLFQWYFA